MATDFQHVSAARSILDAAQSLFLRDGFETVSVAQIAEQAQVSKANVFHHFHSKEALYIDVMREASIGHAEFAEHLLQEDLSSAEKLRRLALWEFEDSFHNEGRVRLLIREVFGGCRIQARQLAREVFRRNFDAVIGLFVQGQQRGEFRPDFDPAVAALMLGATSGMYAQTREGLRQFPQFRYTDDPRGYANAAVDLVLTSILVPARHDAETAARPTAASRAKKTRSAKR
jgi:TetR/AcrR family transcriptional regulator